MKAISRAVQFRSLVLKGSPSGIHQTVGARSAGISVQIIKGHKTSTFVPFVPIHNPAIPVSQRPKPPTMAFNSDSEDEDFKKALALSQQEPSRKIQTPDIPVSQRPKPPSNSDSEDEEIKKALALSLQEPSPKRQTSEVIDLVSSDEEQDVPPTAKTVATSSRSAQNTSIKSNGGPKLSPGGDNKEDRASTSESLSVEAPIHIPLHQAPAPGPANGILGSLNRKQMEEERQARAAQRKKDDTQTSAQEPDTRKRKASASPPGPENRGGRQVIAKLSEQPSLEEHTAFLPVSPTRDKNKMPEVMSYKSQQANDGTGMQYPDGVVKKTWVHGCSRQGDDIKIEEVLQKDDLELAVLSSYMIDPAWVERKINSKTKVFWILHEKEETEVSMSTVFFFLPVVELEDFIGASG